MEIVRFVEASNASRSAPEIFNLLVEIAKTEGFDQIAYGSVNYREVSRFADYTPKAIILNYPLDWQKSYFDRKDFEIDPVLQMSPQIGRAFEWKTLETMGALNKRQRGFLNLAEEAGLRDGVSVPINGVGGRLAVVSFAASSKGADAATNLRRLTILATQFHVAYSDLANGAALDVDLVHLSSRERDCLSWIAQGKSSWDIGAILGISENTVNFHIKSAMSKLNTSNRTFAVVRAIQRGLIDLPDAIVSASRKTGSRDSEPRPAGLERFTFS
jgi:LuxR family quorum-sensing system transcriptional regulator CciR